MATAVAVLVGAAAAIAATTLNKYTVKPPLKPNKATAASIKFTQDFTADNADPNQRTAPLIDITATYQGLKANQKPFKTCTLAQIAAASSDTVCPKGALIAKGSITAVLGPTSDTSKNAAGTGSCDPLLHAWNGGPGTVVFFFVDTAAPHNCLGGAITTGQVGPYAGKIKEVKGALVIDTPIPSYVSFPLPGLEGSLLTQHLVWGATTKVKGKNVGVIQAVSCKGGKRAWSVKFTAENGPGGAKEVKIVKGVQKCS
jgi:hypothetical protein